MPVRLIIIGDGEMRNILNEVIIKTGINNDVLLPGYLDDAHLANPPRVNNSLTEGFPITIIEAMSEGVPIIATNVGSIPDVIENNHTGLIINSGDEAELEAAIIDLYSDKDKRQRMSDNSREFARKNFGSKKMHEEYIKIYEKVLAL